MKALIILLLLSSSLQAQRIYSAVSCNKSDVQAAINNEMVAPADGDIIVIPTGSCSWTGAMITVTFPNSITIQGAGALSPVTGGSLLTGRDNTIINDPGDTLGVTVNSPKSLRITGIYFNSTCSVGCSNNGILQIGGTSTKVRVDHCHFTANHGVGFAVFGSMTGVGDHNYFDSGAGLWNNGVGWNNNPSDCCGDASWSDGDNWGTSKFFFIEDSIFHNDVNDSHDGGRYVLRHDTITVDSGADGHAVNHGLTGSRSRAMREAEVYMNNWNLTGAIGKNQPTFSLNSGNLLYWGNNANGYQSLVEANYTRSTAATYVYNLTPTGWGYCGPVPTLLTGGLLTTNGTALTSSAQFSTSWPAGTMINTTASGCVDAQGVGACTISTVNSTSSITSVENAGVHTNITFQAGAPWDGNTTAFGYPCLDMPGRGKGDVLVNDFPNVLNQTQGNIVAWPRQALSPFYVWNNTYTNPTNSANRVRSQANMVTDNVEYYQEFATLGESGTFDGTRGVGQGLNSAKPATCTAGAGGTPGVGYWATDQNILYVCNPTNVFTFYYYPYTYPNPLSYTFPTQPSGVRKHARSIALLIAGVSTAAHAGTVAAGGTISK